MGIVFSNWSDDNTPSDAYPRAQIGRSFKYRDLFRVVVENDVYKLTPAAKILPNDRLINKVLKVPLEVVNDDGNVVKKIVSVKVSPTNAEEAAIIGSSALTVYAITLSFIILFLVLCLLYLTWKRRSQSQRSGDLEGQDYRCQPTFVEKSKDDLYWSKAVNHVSMLNEQEVAKLELNGYFTSDYIRTYKNEHGTGSILSISSRDSEESLSFR